MRPLRSELPVLFGDIENGGWADEAKHMQNVEIPSPLRVQLAGKVHAYCNRAMAVPLRAALDNIVARGLAGQLRTFDGCFSIRKQRGDALRLSTHSWGMAVDINAFTNQLGTRGDISAELVACFCDEGFVWGGEWERPDMMHFQFVTED